MQTNSTTTTALILLALDAGAIWATALVMIHLWLRDRPLRRPTGRHRFGVPRTAPMGALPDAFDAMDPDMTPRFVDPAAWPTAILAAAVDPWGAAEDADSLLALAA